MDGRYIVLIYDTNIEPIQIGKLYTVALYAHSACIIYLKPSSSLHLLESDLIVANDTDQGLHAGVEGVDRGCHGYQPQHDGGPAHRREEVSQRLV